MPLPETIDTATNALLQRLERLHAAGVQQVPRAARRGATPVVREPLPADDEPAAPGEPPRAESIAADKQAVAESAGVAGPVVHPAHPLPPQPLPPRPVSARLFNDPAPPADDPASTAATLEVLQDEVAGCTRCGELAGTRQQTVFGVGDPSARLCFLGEAPGADEDRLGEPFVGRAGQLLDKIIAACHLRREEVYILNILKCRPPGNRNPTPDESSNCKYFLRRQLELIDPEYVCCLGAVAAQNLLDTTASIGRLRGRLHEYRGVKVACTYHPAYLLRNPAAKKDTWDDMKMLMRQMGVEL
ncbi:MAG: uracil-DNA glycosylase [Planctomycetota bacterium]